MPKRSKAAKSEPEPDEPVVDEPENLNEIPLLSTTNGDAAEPEPEPEPEQPEKFDVDLRDSGTLVPLMRAAWNEVKGDDDAAYDDCQPQHQWTLVQHAVSTITTGGVQAVASLTSTVPERLTSVNANLKPVRDFCETV